VSKKPEQAQSDTADLLALRQATILKQLYKAIQDGGLTAEMWIHLITLELRKATRGYGSDHLQIVLDNFTDYRFYKSPYRLSKLVKLLRREFDNVMRLYTQAGRLQLEADVGEFNVRTTLSDPVPIQESLPGVDKK